MKAKSFALYALYFWLIFFGLIPLLMMFAASFLSKDSHHLVALPFTLENYTSLFTAVFVKIFLRSLLIACITTFFCLLIAYPFSYLLIKSRQQSILLLLIIIPFWTSSLIRTYSLIAILKYKGVLNAILLKLHLIHAPLSLLYTNFAVIIGLVYNLFPFMVLPIFTNMERFDFRLFEAAKDLGANKWSIFTRVFLPSTAPGVLSGCLLVLLPAMTLFYIPNVLGGARSILLGNLIQNQFLVLSDWPQGSATSVMLTSLLLLLFLIFRPRKNGAIQ
ncbi:spermidine/putrescine ABC transporter permease PotB [Fluoribacter dumoffii]|uniref:Spermidine/putrescine transport system permease protein PotB n=1 Tax=Fluoribacter dumoffii TaxID=463 RepID=A0A377GEQ9_9GAMM|nr:ABC transporter permease subunit [Fluoribacter dumoffii]KTC91122.1 spermidine/putrescine ABC transporter permease PotB [Fluoribacter dumoffii NY 23]MCW8416731.1 spermidine/putrescine ABC transporter permease PotB [Fluoribacter dumoffii]MCW8455429.1 spermidine/putrescine ABC transporter permease PotB [Fluoribacter dumoffii]MCW8460493.1 spermidine/putrescine ABC transporter permease PotB [Fluoribacter dumoffii]MCW8483974.1 spermidine/putrescine ABC transporter permease PotB [Fluoribacter dumo